MLRFNFLKNRKTVLIALILVSQGIMAQVTSSNTKKVDISYGSKGFQFKTIDERFLLHIESRLQFRFATPYDQNPVTFENSSFNSPLFKINRARLKVGGHAFQPWLKYYWAYELREGNMLDFQLTIEKWDFLKLKVGQWKILYNRERVISSGKQQMVDRSILNRPFTIDRQQGISIYGRLFQESTADISYFFSILTGTGRGDFINDDSNFMYVGRLQWNFLGRELEMIGSDVAFHDKPTALLALGAVTNRSPYTRFSQVGGGQLTGFEDGVAGQYRVKQALVETAFMYRGFSWQQELHFKNIYDNVNLVETELYGNYIQAGYLFHNLWDWFPKPMEVSGRHSFYIPNKSFPNIREEEYALAVNWFFAKHRNKLTAEVTYIDFQNIITDVPEGWQFRLQWDISF